MRTILFKFNDLRIFSENGEYFALYDAGAHQVRMRKDALTEEEAKKAVQSKDDAIQVLFALQKRLSEAGEDPYASNTDEL